MKKKGFTLVELLVVLVIIGIIIGLILPNTLRAIAEANAKESASNLRAIDTAVQLCYTSERDWDACDSVASLETDGYLDIEPIDPFGIGYEVIDNPDGEGKRSNREAHFNIWPPQGFKDHVNFNP